jgi:hypothetical protein
MTWNVNFKKKIPRRLIVTHCNCALFFVLRLSGLPHSASLIRRQSRIRSIQHQRVPCDYFMTYQWQIFSPTSINQVSNTDMCLSACLHYTIISQFMLFHSYHIHLPTTLSSCPASKHEPIQPSTSDVYNCRGSHSGIVEDFTSLKYAAL